MSYSVIITMYFRKIVIPALKVEALTLTLTPEHLALTPAICTITLMPSGMTILRTRRHLVQCPK